MKSFILGICLLCFSVILYCVKLLSLAIWTTNHNVSFSVFKKYFYENFQEINFFVFIFFVVGTILLIK